MGRNTEWERRGAAGVAVVGAPRNGFKSAPCAHLFTPSMRLFERRQAAAARAAAITAGPSGRASPSS